MKKLWNQYSYAITLILLSCSLAILLSFQNYSNDQGKYITVKISEGDSLWELSNQYSGQHKLTNGEFVGWVKKHNKDVGDSIFPGEEIIIPVSKKNTDLNTQLASAVAD